MLALRKRECTEVAGATRVEVASREATETVPIDMRVVVAATVTEMEATEIEVALEVVLLREVAPRFRLLQLESMFNYSLIISDSRA